jgi:hypothetical protein
MIREYTLKHGDTIIAVNYRRAEVEAVILNKDPAAISLGDGNWLLTNQMWHITNQFVPTDRETDLEFEKLLGTSRLWN